MAVWPSIVCFVESLPQHILHMFVAFIGWSVKMILSILLLWLGRLANFGIATHAMHRVSYSVLHSKTRVLLHSLSQCFFKCVVPAHTLLTQVLHNKLCQNC